VSDKICRFCRKWNIKQWMECKSRGDECKIVLSTSIFNCT